MKNKSDIITGIERSITLFVIHSKMAGKEALEAKRKYEAAGPGSWHFDYWLRYRAEARNWGQAARELRKVLV